MTLCMRTLLLIAMWGYASLADAHEHGGDPPGLRDELIDYAVADFTAQDEAPDAVRGVHVRVARTGSGEPSYLLCGEFQPAGDDAAWTTFATIKTDPYEQWLGGQAQGLCERATPLAGEDEDLSAALQAALDSPPSAARAAASTVIPAKSVCDGDQGFGVPFGADARGFDAREIRSERPNAGFAAYRIESPAPDPRFESYTVETERKSGRIFEVTAHRRIVPDIGPGPDYRDRVIPLAKSLVSELSRQTGIPVDVADTPPYSGSANGVELGLWFAFGQGGKDASYTVSCTHEALKDEVTRAILQAEFDHLGE